MDLKELEIQLTEMGLSDKEARAYLSLLQFGTRTTSFVASRANLNRGTTYVALHALLDMGLVVKSTRNRIQYFTALAPESLQKYIERKSQEVEKKRKIVQEIVGPLGMLVNPLTSRPQVEYFEGVEGARRAIEQTLTARKELKLFLSVVDLADFIGHEYFEGYTNRRIAAGLSLQVIRTMEQDKEAERTNIYAKRYRTNRKELRELRYVSDDLSFPISMYLYDDKVTMISSRKEYFALTVTSSEFSLMQKKLFSLLWKTARINPGALDY